MLRWLLALVVVGHVYAAEPGALYQQHCELCHGAEGRGDGPATARLPTPPADFTAASFKLRSTPSGSLPTDDDLLGTLTRGVSGAGMPSFAGLSLEDRRALVEKVKALSRPREGGDSYFTSRPVGRVIAVPSPPRVDSRLLAKGKKLYRDLSCASCHGEEGRGDGRSAAELKDYAGRPLRPTDFTLGIFKGGADPRQLYLRIATGLNGTPMAEYGDEVLKPDERWALVEYLISLVGK
jgi:mono/diheme cytochrome c family protein